MWNFFSQTTKWETQFSAFAVSSFVLLLYWLKELMEIILRVIYGVDRRLFIYMLHRTSFNMTVLPKAVIKIRAKFRNDMSLLNRPFSIVGMENGRLNLLALHFHYKSKVASYDPSSLFVADFLFFNCRMMYIPVAQNVHVDVPFLGSVRYFQRGELFYYVTHVVVSICLFIFFWIFTMYTPKM